MVFFSVHTRTNHNQIAIIFNFFGVSYSNLLFASSFSYSYVASCFWLVHVFIQGSTSQRRLEYTSGTSVDGEGFVSIYVKGSLLYMYLYASSKLFCYFFDSLIFCSHFTISDVSQFFFQARRAIGSQKGDLSGQVKWSDTNFFSVLHSASVLPCEEDYFNHFCTSWRFVS